jgi:hypothetical protein
MTRGMHLTEWVLADDRLIHTRSKACNWIRPPPAIFSVYGPQPGSWFEISKMNA